MKGDRVRIRGVDFNEDLEVTTSGRRLRVKKDRVFLTADELTRTGRITRSLIVRLDSVITISTEGEDIME